MTTTEMQAALHGPFADVSVESLYEIVPGTLLFQEDLHCINSGVSIADESDIAKFLYSAEQQIFMVAPIKHTRVRSRKFWLKVEVAHRH